MSFPILSGKAIVDTGYNVDNSCRFNDGDSPYMYKDLGTSTAGSGSKFTFSVWVKRGVLGTDQYLFSGGVAASNHLVDLCFKDDDTLRYRLIYNNTTYGLLRTDAKFRDPGAWMHIVINMDTTQGTAADRTSMYVNGTKVTSFSTSDRPNQNSTFTVNNNTVNSQRKSIGRSEDSSGDHFDGYMAEVVWIDGSTLAASSFGEFNEDSPNIWQPVDVSGLTFGTHGFYLDFEASDNLGNDANGGTDLTESGLAAQDQTVDTCTNNFATVNLLDNYKNGSTFSEGNCQIVTGGATYSWNTGTIGLSAGKFYWETELDAEGSGGSALFGISDRPTISTTEELGGLATTYAYLSSGNFRTNNTNTSNSVSASPGDIIGIALNLDDNEISYYKNNVLIVAAQSITAPASTLNGFYFPAWGDWLDGGSGTVTFKVNFGNPPYANSSDAADGNGYGAFEYAPPSGFLAICTKNLGSTGG